MSSTDRRTGANSIGWPIVVLAGMGIAAFVCIFALIPDNEPASRTALLATISVAGQGLVVWFTGRRTGEIRKDVAEVKEQVTNGNS